MGILLFLLLRMAVIDPQIRIAVAHLPKTVIHQVNSAAAHVAANEIDSRLRGVHRLADGWVVKKLIWPLAQRSETFRGLPAETALSK
jgi:hypothetical protein